MPGLQVITDARVYFQPAVDWRGEGTVRSHPLAHIAAVVRRRASLRPTGATSDVSTTVFITGRCWLICRSRCTDTLEVDGQQLPATTCQFCRALCNS